jgi:hypothetical protein
MQMNNPKQPQRRPESADEVADDVAKPNKGEEKRDKDDQTPGELLEGEADPGLTITGGSGHA